MQRVGRIVGQDDLFEKPGERGAAEEIRPSARKGPPVASPPPVPPAAPAPAAAPVVAAPRPPAPSAPVRPFASRPASGCLVVDVPGLLAALSPAGKPLVINHWATWCDPCVEELPRLVRAHAGLADAAEFIGVSWDLFDHPGDPKKVAKKVAKFADSAGVGYPSVLFTGEPDQLFEALGLSSQLIPQTVVIAADGTELFRHHGMLTDDDVFPLIRAARGTA